MSKKIIDAIVNDDLAGLSKLLVDGGDSNSREVFGGYSALHVAIDKDNLEIVKILIANGADVSDTSNTTSSSPLGNAALGGRSEIVRFLVVSGAELAPSEYGLADELREHGEHDIANVISERLASNREKMTENKSETEG